MKKKIFWICLGIILIPLLCIIVCYLIVEINASHRTYNTVTDVPPHEYALLLGTFPHAPTGERNPDFDNRIKSAVELYKAGKIKKIIASGGDYWKDENGNFRDNGYNELRSMRDSLEHLGVPFEFVTLDYDGTTTLNSIVKAKEIYGINSCIIITRPDLNKRTLFHADHYGLNAISFNAEPSHDSNHWLKNLMREAIDRVKLFVNLYRESKPTFSTYIVSFPNIRVEDWYDKPDSVPGIPGSIGHFSATESSWGFYKYFSTVHGQNFYYNSRHGFYVSLPIGIGYNQHGENMMGSHSNEFYNFDTTLVVHARAMFYDVLLIDYPHYEDSLKLSERQFLDYLGVDSIKQLSPNTWISQGHIDHSNHGTPPADRYIRKWILKKDISGRECEMSLTIFFDDTLSRHFPEFKSVIDQFPNCPVIKSRS